ncbi:MAG: hypothetical protein ACOYNL_10650 [Rickettsiales bacterium]
MSKQVTDISKLPAVDYKPLPLGTKGKPWPKILRGEDAKGVRTFGPGLHQSDSKPLWLHSARPYHEVMPELYRDMPVPGLFDAFEAVLANPLVYLESDPGYGKTFLASYVGRAMHPKGAIIADAGGKNLESLLFETVFDANDSNDLIDRINHALADGTLTEPSLKALRELKKNQGGTDGVPLLSEEGGKKVFDWQGLQNSDVPREKIDSVLSSIQKYQEWNGGLRIGFKDVPGKLIQAAIEHRPLVIDEFARRKPGTEAVLQQVWQVINGEIPTLSVSLGNLGEFILHHGDIPKVIITSNQVKDGKDVHPISDSLSSRFKTVKAPAFSEEDWAHRINQKLAGVPISTQSRLEEGQMENGEWQVSNQAAFTKNMHHIHRGNRPAVSPLQTTLIDNWPAVMIASAALAEGFHKSAELLDPESPTLQNANMSAIRFEVDKPGNRAKKLTPRDALRILEQSVQHMAEAVPATETKGADFSDWSMPNIRPTDEPVEEHLGDRMKTLINQWIDDAAGVTIDGAERPKLYAQLITVWKDAGILGPNSVLDGLNLKSKKVAVTSDNALQLQATINALLQSKYPGAEGITPQQAESFLESLEVQRPTPLDAHRVLTNVATADVDAISNNDLMEQVSVGMRPLATGENGWKEFIDSHPAEHLVDQDTVIATLGMPYANKELLRAISKRPNDASDGQGVSYHDKEPYMMTTTLTKAADGSYAKIHVLHSRNDGKTLVITSKPSALKMPPESGVTVVQAASTGATKMAREWLAEHVATTSHNTMRSAFELRNSIPDNLSRAGLAEILTSPDTMAFSPTVVDERTNLPPSNPSTSSTILHQGTVAPRSWVDRVISGRGR